MLVNAINGGEADCVIAILTPPVPRSNLLPGTEKSDQYESLAWRR